MSPRPAAPPVGLSAAGQAAWRRLFEAAIAHRGLWAPDGPPENSLAAFDAACEAGYGIELDVQLSRDGEAVVFHDERLEHRLTAASGRVAEHTAAELSQIRIGGSAQTIPTLQAALERVAGRTLILVELKVRRGDEGPMERRVAELLDGYDGPVAVISFNPATIAWFADRRPGVLRGLDLQIERHAQPGAKAGYVDLDAVDLARPHFLLPELALVDLQYFEGLPVVPWTVRSPEQAALAAKTAANIIFESWRP